MPENAAVILREEQQLRTGESCVSAFAIVLAHPTLRLREDALLEVRGCHAPRGRRRLRRNPESPPPTRDVFAVSRSSEESIAACSALDDGISPYFARSGQYLAAGLRIVGRESKAALSPSGDGWAQDCALSSRYGSPGLAWSFRTSRARPHLCRRLAGTGNEQPA